MVHGSNSASPEQESSEAGGQEGNETTRTAMERPSTIASAKQEEARPPCGRGPPSRGQSQWRTVLGRPKH
eukprot:4961838-Alexandrium_andersonii.AAC.1